MLEIILPLSFISRTIHMYIRSLSISFIILPLSFEYISIYMIEFAFSVRFVILPFAYFLILKMKLINMQANSIRFITFISCTIWPLLLSISISHVTLPFSIIYCPTFKCVRWSLLPLV